MAEGSQLIRLAIFGQPVARSLSPRIHGLFADQFGLELEYRAIEATHATFPSLVDDLVNRGGRGCNVTVPLKGDAWRLATHCSAAAQRARAANTLVFTAAGERRADNTDGKGLVEDLASMPGFRPAASEICLIGAGGATAGVLGALLEAGAGRLVIANRTRDKADDLVQRHKDLGRISACALSEIGQNPPFDLVINATSLGHQGLMPDLRAAWLKPGGLVYDMNYGAASKPLRDFCAASNIRYCDGLGMLVEQAAVSFSLWTGKTPETRGVLSQLGRFSSGAENR